MSLEKKLIQFSRKAPMWNYPLLCEHFNTSTQDMAEALANIWEELPRPVINNKLIYTDYDTTLPAYYEVCDTKYKRGKTIPKSKLEVYSKNNKKEDQHVSVYLHDEDWKRHAEEEGNVKVRTSTISADILYLEVDGQGLEESMQIAYRIWEGFEYRDFMTFYTSGNRSIHIELPALLFGTVVDYANTVGGYGRLFYNLAHKVSGGARHPYGVSDPHFFNGNVIHRLYEKLTGKKADDLQQAKNYIQTIDPNIYNGNSLIRQRYSIHEKSGNPKEEVSIFDLATASGEIPTLMSYERKLKPYLIDWTFECYNSKRKKVDYTPSHEKTELDKAYSEIDDYDPADADSDGWCGPYCSPLYEDHNPGVYVNIQTGWYKDFGEPSHSFDVYEFYSRLKGIDRKEAEKKLNG